MTTQDSNALETPVDSPCPGVVHARTGPTVSIFAWRLRLPRIFFLAVVAGGRDFDPRWHPERRGRPRPVVVLDWIRSLADLPPAGALTWSWY